MTNPFFRLSTKEKMFFARQMSVMSKAGISTLEILSILKKQTKSSTFKTILDQLIASVRNGRFLSDGLEKYKGVFGEFFINIIHVGEISGTLSENLEYLADSLKKRKELESKVKGALVYPAIILIATLGITAVLTFFVFPKILPVFRSLKVELPGSTKIFIAFSTFMIQHGLVVFGVIIAFFIGFWLILKIPAVRYRWDSMLLHIPALGTMIQNYNMVIFARSMSLLLRSGVQIVQALTITSTSTENLVYKKRLSQIAQDVNQGDLISTHMAKSLNLFSPVFTQMLAVGERTGKLSETGIFLAEYYDAEVESSTKALSNIMEPAILVVMGGLVAFIAISIILPIYKVTQNFSK